jgi:HAD superfamily hydrolase (TIGR01509 family)
LAARRDLDIRESTGFGTRREGSFESVIEAVIFDLDGVLVDSEQVWNEARARYVQERGGRWHERAQQDMMGMSSTEWSRYVHDELGVDRAPDEISRDVAQHMALLYREQLPIESGARNAVERLGSRWPLALASSSNRELIDLVLELSCLAARFTVTVSSEEVSHGKPAPDVYLEAARRLGVEPLGCVAIEDSHNGILSAVSAGMQVIAVPNRTFPPGEDALGKAVRIVPSVDELTPQVIESLDRRL